LLINYFYKYILKQKVTHRQQNQGTTEEKTLWAHPPKAKERQRRQSKKPVQGATLVFFPSAFSKVLQTKVKPQNEKTPAKFARAKKGTTNRAGESEVFAGLNG
jgi:hypothetical protein